ncbi:hypothetical protein [Pseudomonas sp.]|uniref:hypothetical protein n=1 Tax=Pseudomonas sp. TaxID=306 RepID=UPI001984F54C|nr:hypothetical protein [Pseudomonas sp.]MBC6626187.1 hypothetical protein [Pseudomonas sp.]
MSNAIAGVALPANVVPMFRQMLAAIASSGTAEDVDRRVWLVVGVLRTLECLQRINPRAGRKLYDHVNGLAEVRIKELSQRAKEAGHVGA